MSLKTNIDTNREDMIINKLHLNPAGVLNLVKSMKEVTDEAESNMEFHEIIDNQVSKLHGKEMETEFNSLKVYTDDLGCVTPDLTMQVLNYYQDTRGYVELPKNENELSYITKDVIMQELLQQYVPERDISEEEISSKDFDKVIKGVTKDFSLDKFQSNTKDEKQGVAYKIEQTFKGNINGVVVKNAEVFDTTVDILQSIEKAKNIPMHDKEFTENLVEAVQRMSDKNDQFNYTEMLEGTYANLTSAPTLKDFKIVDYYGQRPENSYAANLNAKMENGDYEHLNPQTNTRVNSLTKEKSMTR